MITGATINEYPTIIDVWERSVRATHDFLPEDYLQQIKMMLPSILPHVDLYTLKNSVSVITGFIGVAESKIEMLFIDPPERGKGTGRLLAQYAIDKLGATKVDVNEQNDQAVGFYKHLGFVAVGRTDTDGLGKPFPLIQMEIYLPGS